MKKLLIITALLCSSVYADAPDLDILTQNQADAIAEEFSANFAHAPVSGASTLGSIFGLEVGLIFGLSDSPKTNAASKETDPNASLEQIAHAGAFASVSLPLGITGELVYVPEVGSELKFNYLSYGLKYTLPDSLNIPFDVAIRVHGSSSELSYNDIVNNSSTGNTDVNTNVTFDMSSFGYHVVASKKFLMFEPYVGIGAISTDTDISTSASSSVSIFNFTSADNYSSDNSGSHFFLGANLNLLFFKIGAEYSKVMDVDRYTAKLSFYF